MPSKVSPEPFSHGDPDGCGKSLEIVPAPAIGQAEARDNPARKPVRRSVVAATLPSMTAEVADLIRFIRHTSCRPSEARLMKLCSIRDRHKRVWRYVPKRHKTSHHGEQRHVPIGPRAQAIVLVHTAGRSDRDNVFTPERSVPQRKHCAGVITTFYAA